ncbi:MAG: selenium metabolism-associated LysR family transcriptional regulator [Thermodesulfovibrionales bacterium]|nr:selenium metabolism-associated LysR family transcriptional regulator [Thermodesulfovibrionales bacterium]
MDDHRLKVFCTVAETKSFSKASEIIHLTQPAVSLQIQALEEIYDTKLFDRSSSTVTLTPAGEILYRYAKQILGLYAQAEREIASLTGLIKGSIRAGASTTIANYLLPSIISDFKKINKKVRFHVLIGNTKRIVDHLNNGIVYFGLVEGDVSKYKLKADRILKDELVVIVSSDHPFSGRKSVSVHELVNEPFILREEGSGTRQVIEKYFLKFGISVSDLNVVAVLGGTEAIKEAVEDGAGISIVSKWAVRREVSRGTLRMIPLKEERLTRDFSLIHKNPVLTSAANEFVEYLKKYEYEKLFQRSK